MFNKGPSLAPKSHSFREREYEIHTFRHAVHARKARFLSLLLDVVAFVEATLPEEEEEEELSGVISVRCVENTERDERWVVAAAAVVRSE